MVELDLKQAQMKKEIKAIDRKLARLFYPINKLKPEKCMKLEGFDEMNYVRCPYCFAPVQDHVCYGYYWCCTCSKFFKYVEALQFTEKVRT